MEHKYVTPYLSIYPDQFVNFFVQAFVLPNITSKLFVYIDEI